MAQTTANNVGLAIHAAMARGDEHEKRSARRLRVRFMTHYGCYREGLTIMASIAAHSDAEAQAQMGRGIRQIPWELLDRCAHLLPEVVDGAVAEIEQAIGVKSTS